MTIRRPFYLVVHPVTQDQFQRLMGTNPSHFCRGGRGKDGVGDDDPRLLPVEKVTWGGAVSYCRKLSETPGSRTFTHEVFNKMHYGVTSDLAAVCLMLLAVVVLGGVAAAVLGRLWGLTPGSR